MLDVAAVAEQLIAALPFAAPLKQAFIFLTALHDLGKINADFCAMLRGAARQGLRHWEASEVLLRDNLDLLAAQLSPGRRSSLIPLIAATAGHHGRPPHLADVDERRSRQWIGTEAEQDAGAVIAAFASLWPDASLAGPEWEDVIALSWWLPGLVSAADWIGSNTDWFPAVGQTMDLASYLHLARLKAETAVKAAGFTLPPLWGYGRVHAQPGASYPATTYTPLGVAFVLPSG